MELLEELHQAGKTIIISTHDVELAYPWADRVILLREGEILQEDVPEVAFGDPDLVRRARLSMPVLLELYQELARRGLPLPEKRPKTALDMIHLIEQAFSRGAGTGPCGTIHVCDVDRTGPDALSRWLSSREGLWIGAMGTRAKQRAAEGKITLDFTYGVIDKCLLRALGGESSLILTARGMVQRVEVRVTAFSAEWGTPVPVEEVKEP
jgi:cobalt/nickel transport system ATP-binding protein